VTKIANQKEEDRSHQKCAPEDPAVIDNNYVIAYGVPEYRHHELPATQQIDFSRTLKKGRNDTIAAGLDLLINDLLSTIPNRSPIPHLSTATSRRATH